MTSKTERARQIATELFDSMPYDALKTKIKEDVPCSRTLAHNAIAWVRNKRKETEGKPQAPTVEIVAEEKKEPQFIEEPKEEIKAEEPKPIQKIEPMPVIGDLEIFKDMMRGFYIMILSKKGLLGSKYGRNEDQCVQCSDQMFRWLYKRYGDELLKQDTILLVLSHGALIGGIMTEWWNDRKKAEAKKETKKKPEKTSETN